MNIVSNNNEREMIERIAARIPENNPDDLMTVWEYLKTLPNIKFPIIKELQTAGIPIMEELSGLLGLTIFETAVFSRVSGIEFTFIDAAFKNMVLPGAVFGPAN
jgi:hypothetical protein